MNDLITTTELLLVQSALPGILGFPVLTLVVAVSICGSPHFSHYVCSYNSNTPLNQIVCTDHLRHLILLKLLLLETSQ
jgi:hypothetical protein